MPATVGYALFVQDCDHLHLTGREMVAEWQRCPAQAREPGLSRVKPEDVPAVERYRAACRRWCEALERIDTAGAQLQRRWKARLDEGPLTAKRVQNEMQTADAALRQAIEGTKELAIASGWQLPATFGPEPSLN
jgi:hypothetical protein